MNEKLASPKALGYGAIFITVWLFSLFNTQWYTLGAHSPIFIMGLVVGGAAVFIAGIISYLRSDSYEGTLFVGFGALSFSISLIYILASPMMGSGFSAIAGWVDIVWTVFFLSIWIGVMKRDMLVSLFMFGLWLTFLDLAIANWMGSTVCMYVGGYIGLVTAALAACLSARELISSVKKVEPSQA